MTAKQKAKYKRSKIGCAFVQHSLILSSEANDLLHLVYDCLECLGIVYCEVSEDLAVNLDTCLVESSHQLAVAHILQACSCIDTLNPESTESALRVTAIAVCVGQSLLPSVLSNGPYVLSGAEVTLGELQNSCSLCFRCNVIY